MTLNNFIDYVYKNKSHDEQNIELEIRFGKYSNVSSNINIKTFTQIFQLDGSNKKYTLIKERILDSNVKERSVYKNDNIKTLFSKLKTYIDKSPDDLKSDIKSVIDMTLKTPPVETHFMTKDRIKKPISGANYKIALLNEKITNNNFSTKNYKPESKLKHVKKSEISRYKLRCNWLNKMWLYDITILFYCDSSNLCGVHFEVEIEYNHKASLKGKYSQYQVLECATKHIRDITTIIDCNSTKMTSLSANLKKGLHNSVATLERQSLSKLTNSAYSLCDKADGERKFIYINSRGSIFHINPTDSMLEQVLIGTKSIIKNVLIDCELIAKNKHGTKIDTFYGFDLLFYENIDYRNHNLPARLKLMQVVLSSISKLESKYLYKSKQFYMTDIFKHAKRIWDNRKTIFPYELDGLIFTPVHGSYLGHMPILKWKYLHSIDVRIMYNKNTNFTEFYANSYPIVKKNKGKSVVINEYKDHKTGNIYYRGKVIQHIPDYKKWQLVNNNGILGMSGKIDTTNLENMVDIVEMEFLPDKKIWKYLRKRPDKEKPNSFLSIKSVMDAVVGNITIDTLANLKHNPSTYEKIGKLNSNCFSNVGFNFLIPDNQQPIYKPIYHYYTYVYNNILSQVKGKSIMVLGGDKCIINALLQSSYTDICIIEKNCLEVYGRLESEGYKGLLQHLEQLNTKGKLINIIWGNSSTIIPYQKEESKLIKNKYDTVWINSFESLCLGTPLQNLQPSHKLQFSKSKFEKSMTLIKQMSKNIIGVYLSGDNIKNNIKKNICVVLKDSNLNPLYKLYSQDQKIYKSPDIFKHKPQFVEIQRIRDNFHTECQPLLYDANVVECLKLQKLKIKHSKNFKHSYNAYIKNQNESLTEYDCIIADITKFFII
jgi:hypothetical protein